MPVIKPISDLRNYNPVFVIIRKEQHRQSHKVHHLYHQLHHQSKNQNIHNCTTSWVVFLYYHDIGDNVSNIMKGAEKLWP